LPLDDTHKTAWERRGMENLLVRTTRVSNAIGLDCPAENVAAGSKRRAITT